MTKTAAAPTPPAPVRLVPAGEPGVWAACGDRFTITRYRAPKRATEDEREQADAGALDIVDHYNRGTLGDIGANRARVYDRDDAVGVITRVLRVEYRDALARHRLRNQATAGVR